MLRNGFANPIVGNCYVSPDKATAWKWLLFVVTPSNWTIVISSSISTYAESLSNCKLLAVSYV